MKCLTNMPYVVPCIGCFISRPNLSIFLDLTKPFWLTKRVHPAARSYHLLVNQVAKRWLHINRDCLLKCNLLPGQVDVHKSLSLTSLVDQKSLLLLSSFP